MNKSVAIIVSAYNEEKNIENAVRSVLSAIKGIISDFEIVIVNDGSTDGTHAVAEKLLKNTNIRLINHSHNQGVGKSFQDGISTTKKEYVTVFPGDNDMSADSLRELFQKIGMAELIIGYPKDQLHRPIIRKILSRSFTAIVNTIFNLRIRYYNGPFIVRTRLLKDIAFRSNGFFVFAELKLKLIKHGYSVTEIPFEHVGRKHGESKAVSLPNILDMVQMVVLLFIDRLLRRW